MQKFYLLRRIKYRLGLYNKPHRTSRAALRILAVILILSALSVTVENRLGTLALELGQTQLNNEVLAEANKITSQVIKEQNLSYGSIIIQNKGNDGHIRSLSTDFSAINSLKSEISIRISEYLSGHQKQTCHIPIGSLVSGRLMPASGMTLPVSLICTSDATVEFSDDFCSAGINQTRHRLMIRVTVNAVLRSAFEVREKTVSADIPIAETVISGEVPGLIYGSELKTAPSDN